MGLLYEAYTLPWDSGGFKKKFFWLPVEPGSGTGTIEFLTSSGESSVNILLDKLEEAGRDLSEIVSDTTSSLIRVIDCLPDGTRTIIDEWVCERPAREHSDSRIVTISGPKLKAKAFDGQTFPAEDGLNPTKNPDHIFGGDNILQSEGFEESNPTPSLYHLLIDATGGDFTLSAGGDTTSPIAFDASDQPIELAIETDLLTIDDVSVRPLVGTPLAYELSISATGGTFTLSDGTDTTSAINWDDTAATIETRLETDITAINDVVVTDEGDFFIIDFVDPVSVQLQIDTTNLTDGSASLSVSRTGAGFEIEFVDPAIENSMTIDPTGLTGDADLVLVQTGENLPQGWTKSTQVSRGTPREYGVYDAFHLSTAQAHSGVQSLFIDPGQVDSEIDAYAGAQQVIGTEPGQTYQASIWIYPTAPGQEYRLVIRGIDEDLMTSKLFNFSPPANTWTQLVVPDIEVDENQVIFRIANINQPTINPAGFYVDDAYLAPGMAANTWGHIVNYFMGLKTSEFDWVDHSSVTDTTDSGGVAWSRKESVTGYFGESFGQFWDKGVDLEYEWDLRPKDTPSNGLTHDLVWYGTGGMDDAPSVGLYPNASVTGGDSLTRNPAYTKVRVEGSDGIFVEVEDTTAVGNFGPIEKHVRDEALHSTESITARANALLAYESANRNAIHFQMAEHATLPRPGTHFRPGDTISMHLPPGLAKTSKRVQSFSYTNSFPTQYLVTGSRVLSGEAAAYSLLWRMWRKFQVPIRISKAGAITGLGGGGTPTIVVAASDASDFSKRAAHFECPGTDDAPTIQAAIDLIQSGPVGGRVLLTEGTYQIGAGQINLGEDLWLEGLGSRTILQTSDTSGVMVATGNECHVSDLTLVGPSGGDTVIGIQGSGTAHNWISRVRFELMQTCINDPGDESYISGCLTESTGEFLTADSQAEIRIVGNTNIRGITITSSGASVTGVQILDNLMEGQISLTMIDGFEISDNVWTDVVGGNVNIITLDTVTAGVINGNTTPDGVGYDIMSITGSSQIIITSNIWDNITNGITTSTSTQILTDKNIINGVIEDQSSNLSQFSQAGSLTVGTGSFKLPFTLDAEIISIQLAAGISPTGADLIVDVNKNGTTIFSTQANRPTVPDSDADGVGAETTPDVTSITEGEYLTVDIDQVGSTEPGEDLTVSIEWKPS